MPLETARFLAVYRTASMPATVLKLEPLDASDALKSRIYLRLKEAICSMNIYAQAEEPRLDERQLGEALGVSRTPIREALARLEQEGFIRTVPRKGAFIVRKTKQEILEMITVWAALESMAARLITEHATDEELSTLRRMFATFDGGQVKARIDEYSATNISFHQALLQLSRCDLLNRMAENLFVHMRSIRMQTIGDRDRARQSIIDHMHIIEALESRDTDLAERLGREHSLNLATHVEQHVTFLD
ncbi:MAG: GntR family transcriptional regulator [Acidobacteria bacterium]|nr:GntR family transcriptional regulator [Acidobacteriota bacterium]